MASERHPELTPANRHTLRHLRRLIKATGHAPTLQELADACLTSKTAAAYQLKQLQDKGAIVRVPGKSRAIRIAS